ncbi:MAG TPA: serine/threonine protein kinase, partial [Spirochaetia bacterium]|nr:serine/threonine protein kinase [Spirochaetia bacterium]
MNHATPEAHAAAFSLLTPDRIISTVEESYGTALSGVITPFPSYINRVFGLISEE